MCLHSYYTIILLLFSLYHTFGRKKGSFGYFRPVTAGPPCGQFWSLHVNKYKHYMRLYLSVIVCIGGFYDAV